MSNNANPIKVSIIGDQFMRADAFADALSKIEGCEFDVSRFETTWPDNPFGPPLEGVKEYQGSPDDTAEQIGDAEICITHLAPVPRSVFERCPNLKLIGVSRGGPVNIDTQAAGDHGVKVVNAPGRNASAVAEFTIGAILSQTRLFTAGHMALVRGLWRGDLYRADTTGQELSQMIVGLVGYSAIGRRVAKLLQPFGCQILFADPFVEENADDKSKGIEKVDLDSLVRTADIVSLHARLTPDTKNMFSKDTFDAMKPGSYFINTARGELLDQSALTSALQSSHLRGAALDTFVPEPPEADDPLLSLPNVTLTPHIAGASVYVVTYAAGVIAADIANFIAGRQLKNPC